MLRLLAGFHLVGSASVLGIAIGIALLTRLERLVLHFFEQRIFGPTRLDKAQRDPST